jgi:20S proteasome alpha/beta subunit
MSFEEFRQNRLQFPDDLYRRDMDEIAKVPLDLDCIIAGFETNGLPMLLQIDTAWGVKIREDFAVSGEGAYLAQSVMSHRSHTSIYTKTQTLSQALYCVYEAKRYAERVVTVGKNTWLVVYSHDGGGQVVYPDRMAFLEEQFKKYGPQELGPIPWNEEFFRPL